MYPTGMIYDVMRNATYTINCFSFHQAGKSVIKSSSSLLTSAKSLAVNPMDPPMWQLLASHTKAVTDSIKSLIMAIR